MQDCTRVPSLPALEQLKSITLIAGLAGQRWEKVTLTLRVDDQPIRDCASILYRRRYSLSLKRVTDSVSTETAMLSSGGERYRQLACKAASRWRPVNKEPQKR